MSNWESLQVRFMSACEIFYTGKKLNIMQSSTSKSAQLLAMLLFYAKDGIPRNKLLAWLYPNADVDAANSLKGLIFRLRKQLAHSFLPDMDFIKVRDGIYTFTDEIVVESDVQNLVDLSEKADAAVGAGERMVLWQQVCEGYRGEILPMFSSELWVAVENAALTERLIRAARGLSAQYVAQRDYERAYLLGRRMSDFFPFDEEWHICRMNSLLSLGRYQQAMDEYEAAISMLFDEMGVYPSERLMDCARAISNKVLFPISAAEDVDRSLREETCLDAYYCSYPSFVDGYRILRRIMIREGIDCCLLLCTVTDQQGKPVENQKMRTVGIQKLSLALGRTLRKSDMYTRYSASQMLAMLWGCTRADAEVSIQRIHAAFGQYGQAREDLMVSYTVLAGDEPPQPIILNKVEKHPKRWKTRI
ncbi:MAG: bacterial transcriptional activator domain-containing protein [Clostridia bacterium]